MIRYDRSAEVFKQSSDQPTDLFGDFVSYYMPGRSRSNGIIERLFDYVQRASSTRWTPAACPSSTTDSAAGWTELANRRTSAGITVMPERGTPRRTPLPAGCPPGDISNQAGWVPQGVDRFCLGSASAGPLRGVLSALKYLYGPSFDEVGYLPTDKSAGHALCQVVNRATSSATQSA